MESARGLRAECTLDIDEGAAELSTELMIILLSKWLCYVYHIAGAIRALIAQYGPAGRGTGLKGSGGEQRVAGWGGEEEWRFQLIPN